MHPSFQEEIMTRRHATLGRLLLASAILAVLSFLPLNTSVPSPLGPQPACASGVGCVFEAGSYCVNPVTGEPIDNHRKNITLD